MRTTLVGRYNYSFAKLSARAMNWVRLRSKNSSLVVLGGYHGENTGDWAMGEAILIAAAEQNIDARTVAMRDAQTVGESTKHVIIGGGAVATPEVLEVVAEVWAKNEFRVTMVGVDFSANMGEFSSLVQRMCQASTSIGLRHGNQYERVRKWANNSDTYVHADLAFSLPPPAVPNSKSRTLAVNVLPLYHMHASGAFKAGSPLSDMYKRNNSGFYGKIEEIANAYVNFVQTYTAEYVANGYRIIHVPFAPEDDAFARAILPKHTVFYPFTLDLAKLETVISNSEVFLPTRFHALVAGLRTHSNIVPLAYAGKAEQLLTDFGVENEKIINREKLISNKNAWALFSPSQESINRSVESSQMASSRAISEVRNGVG